MDPDTKSRSWLQLILYRRLSSRDMCILDAMKCFEMTDIIRCMFRRGLPPREYNLSNTSCAHVAVNQTSRYNFPNYFRVIRGNFFVLVGQTTSFSRCLGAQDALHWSKRKNASCPRYHYQYNTGFFSLLPLFTSENNLTAGWQQQPIQQYST